MVLRGVVLVAALALAGSTAAGTQPPSRSLGVHWDGRLVHGVQLPAEGRTFFTWDPVLRRAPNRSWRRFGNERLVRVLLRTLTGFAAANPDAPRVGIGDLSRRPGGDFGARFGGRGHVSHQNGLDADVYYPRHDRRERSARRVTQVDRALAQDLVDRFVRAGALRVFVGPRLGLRGPEPIVQPLPHHDDHLHVRLPLSPTRRWENDVAGHDLRLPAGWRARADRTSGTTHVSAGRRTARIWLDDLGAIASEAARRDGAPLELGAERRHAGYGLAHSVVFRVVGHVFRAFVKLGPPRSERTAAQAAALLESVRLTGLGRAAANLRSSRVLGRSLEGRRIVAVRIGNPRSPQKLLVVGCIHGDECAGTEVTRRLVSLTRPLSLDLWVIQHLNPDGYARGSRGNARGVDLNRDFDTFSQRETRIARALIERLRPDVTIWFHQPQGLVRAWGRSRATARRYARLAGERYRSLAWPPGSASRWQNGLGQVSFVVELPAGRLDDAAADRHARAVLRLAQ